MSTADKVELFVDDKPVYVDPGTTVLQVCMVQLFCTLQLFYLPVICSNYGDI